MRIQGRKLNTLLLMSLFMLSGAVQAVGGIKSNEKPDITIIGFSLNGQFISGGPVVTVDASKATSFQNGKCLFNVEYNLKNTGDVKTAPLFSTVLKRGNKVVKTHNLLSLDAHSNKVLGFQGVALKPGLNKMGLYADSKKVVVESNENNNYRKALIKIQGSCGSKNATVGGVKSTNNTSNALPGGPKPKCKLGLIPVKEDGIWQCKQAGFKSR